MNEQVFAGMFPSLGNIISEELLEIYNRLETIEKVITESNSNCDNLSEKENDALRESLLDVWFSQCPDEHPAVGGETEFKNAFKKCLAVFQERFNQYGNHLEKDAYEDVAGLYIKANRICRDISDKKELNTDTLIDLVNYALQILSRKKGK